MAHRIEIGFKKNIRDALGEKIKRRINEHLALSVDAVRTVDIYSIDAELSEKELQAAASGPFSDPVIHNFTIGAPIADKFDWLVEVGFLPGVTDNVGKTAREALLVLLNKHSEDPLLVFTSRQYLLNGNITEAQARKIATGLLANELIEHYTITDAVNWKTQQTYNKPYIPRITSKDNPVVETIDLNIGDYGLMLLSKERLLALSLTEMKELQAYFQNKDVLNERYAVGLSDKLTDAELECLAQTWSEHCKHKIFSADITYNENGSEEVIHSLLDTYIKGATNKIRATQDSNDICRSVFVDNAGIIKFDDEYNIVFKVETHNSPSALDPYGGALTGIVGVNRDPFGTGIGAKLIFNTDVFCFAAPDYAQELPPRILHPRRIFEGVREGVEHGGNKSGIPTVNGCIVFDDRFLGKPLVYCGTGGIMPAKINGKNTYQKELLAGDVIVMTGGRIGKDGIHGATFSSEELHEGSPVSAVQIGDPITQKKMFDFLIVARDKALYRCITDNGAGGLSSSVGETARLSGGCELDLQKAPLKYHGLNPWEILISESQERMTLAIAPEKLDEFLQLANKMEVEATPLGTYTDSGYFHIRYGEKTVVYLKMDFLHEGLPPMKLIAQWNQPVYDEPSFPESAELGNELKALLARLNICSKESTVRRYDHEVQAGAVVKPFVGAQNDAQSDAAVVRPLLNSFAGIVVANGICPRYSDIDTYHMAACALDEAVRNAIAVGASLEHLACLDNFCWCDPVASEKTPDGEYKLAQLVRANKALYDYTTAFGIPCISGKDSMKNDYQIGKTKISIPPTLLFSVIGKMNDIRKAVTMDFKRADDIIYIIGVTRNELGASEFFAMHGFIGNAVPKVDAQSAKQLYAAVSRAIDNGLLASAHDCSDGGLGVALTESAFAGDCGAQIKLSSVPVDGVNRDDFILFSETASRLLVSVPPAKKEEFEKAIAGNVFAAIGEVTNDGILTIDGSVGNTVVRASLDELKEAWKKPLNF